LTNQYLLFAWLPFTVTPAALMAALEKSGIRICWLMPGVLCCAEKNGRAFGGRISTLSRRSTWRRLYGFVVR
jgi:hypothetical protein